MKYVARLSKLLVLLMLAVPVWAQDSKVRVSVSHTGDDAVGKQFAYAVREAIRGSNGYRLVGLEDAGIQVNIVSIDPERAATSGSYWTAASISYTMANFLPYQQGNPQTWYPIYLTSQVMTIGAQRVDQQAKSVMATLDEVLDQYGKDVRK